MAEIEIQLLGKNGALIERSQAIDTPFVPRVGELLDAGSWLDTNKQEVSTFIVRSVIYRVGPGGMTPLITAQQWHKGIRHDLLAQRGWAPPGDSELLSYDEDDLKNFDS